ncbi:MAG TPA: hypothetical protein VEW70_10830, partial [Burkholderiales bacterium]|nr:hypothetical protein [Burkholderiales bacterium]
IAQGAIDAALRFRDETGLQLKDLTSVEIRVPHLQPYFRVRPAGEFSGKFGYEYPVACAILDGEIVKQSFSDKAFNRPELKTHLGKFKTLEDPASEKQGPLGALIVVANGKTIVQPIELPTGHPKRPIPPAQVIAKYIRNASEVLGEQVANETALILQEIERLPSIRPLLDKLAKRS